MSSSRSLHRIYPKRWAVLALIGGSCVVLIIAHCLPFLTIKQLIFFEEQYTLLRSVASMWDGKYYVLAVVIFAFSIVFPFAKLIALWVLWFIRTSSDRRRRLLYWLGVLGKWSMLDVFVVAILIVLTQSKGLVDAQPHIGVYLFSAGIVLSMIASMLVERLAKRADG